MTAKFLAGMHKFISAFDLRDVFAFSGLGCAAYGAAQIYVPLGWLLLGSVLLWLGIRR